MDDHLFLQARAFLSRCHQKDISSYAAIVRSIAVNEPGGVDLCPGGYFGVDFDVFQLADQSVELGSLLLERPAAALCVLRQAFLRLVDVALGLAAASNATSDSASRLRLELKQRPPPSLVLRPSAVPRLLGTRRVTACSAQLLQPSSLGRLVVVEVVVEDGERGGFAPALVRRATAASCAECSAYLLLPTPGACMEVSVPILCMHIRPLVQMGRVLPAEAEVAMPCMSASVTPLPHWAGVPPRAAREPYTVEAIGLTGALDGVARAPRGGVRPPSRVVLMGFTTATATPPSSATGVPLHLQAFFVVVASWAVDDVSRVAGVRPNTPALPPVPEPHISLPNIPGLQIVPRHLHAGLASWSQRWTHARSAPYALRSRLAASMAPHLYGLSIVKLAFAIALAAAAHPTGGDATSEVVASLFGADGDGAAPPTQRDGSGGHLAVRSTRSAIHILLLGRRATGKTSLLRWFTAGLRTPGVYFRGGRVGGNNPVSLRGEHVFAADDIAMHGRGQTGLPEVALIGALDAADNKPCGPMVATALLPPAILPYSGPVGELCAAAAVSAAVPPPLLSRFDIVALLTDEEEFAPEGCIAQSTAFLLRAIEGRSLPLEPDGGSASEGHPGVFDAADLDTYFSLIRLAPRPQLTMQASRVLRAWYSLRRGDGGCSVASPRLMLSAVRVAIAHARLMCRVYVVEEDAVAAVSLLDGACSPYAYYSTFAASPDAAFANVKDATLASLEEHLCDDMDTISLPSIENDHPFAAAGCVLLCMSQRMM